jgi:hypothetical protein
MSGQTSEPYDLDQELSLLTPIVAKVREHLASGSALCAEPGAAAATEAAASVLAVVRRLPRGVGGGDTEQYDAMQRMMEETGLDKVLETIGQLAPAVCAAGAAEALGGEALPLEVAVMLQQLWLLPMLLWPWGDPRPMIPSHGSWALLAGQPTDAATRLRMLQEVLPSLKQLITDETKPSCLRLGAVSHTAFASFYHMDMGFWREFIDLDIIKPCLELASQLLPPPSAGAADDLAAAAADTEHAFALVVQSCFAHIAGCTMHALKAADAATPAALAEHYIDSGYLALMLRTLRSFAALPSAASTHPIVGMALASLQMIVLQKVRKRGFAPRST